MIVLGQVEGKYQVTFDYAANRKTTEGDCYYVIADSFDQSEEDIKNADGIPRRGEYVRGAYVSSHKLKQVGTIRHPVTGVMTHLWEVEVEYDSNFSPEAGGRGGEELIFARPIRRWRVEFQDERLTHDKLTGHPIVTQCGEEIVVDAPQAYPVLDITRYEPYPFNPQVILRYVNKVNTGYFYGAPPYCALLQEITAEEVIEEATLLIKATYSIKFSLQYDTVLGREIGFFRKLLHQGYLYREKPGARPSTYVDSSGQPVKVNLFTYLAGGDYYIVGMHGNAPFTSMFLGEAYPGGTLLSKAGDSYLRTDLPPHPIYTLPYEQVDFSPLGLEF